MLPQLTEAEKASPIGAAMGYLMGLFFSLKQQLIIQRSLEAAGEKAKGNAIFSSSTPAIALAPLAMTGHYANAALLVVSRATVCVVPVHVASAVAPDALR